uniref:Uncharacterized protein n=1 Tax=Sphaerodactylus townsendi TaxID=933632 RepID=A0ACB8ESA5_9SAUR
MALTTYLLSIFRWSLQYSRLSTFLVLRRLVMAEHTDRRWQGETQAGAFAEVDVTLPKTSQDCGVQDWRLVIVGSNGASEAKMEFQDSMSDCGEGEPESVREQARGQDSRHGRGTFGAIPGSQDSGDKIGNASMNFWSANNVLKK